jgi:beta-glucanase (GH16 family)
MSNRISIFVFVLFSILFLTQCNVKRQEDIKAPEGYQLVWADEFNEGSMLDTTKWNYRVGDGCPELCGFGNRELQWYSDARPENSRIEDGKLIIEARKEDIGTRNYSSARITTKDKGDWLYGRIEVRAKLPSGVGTWPAIWMMPTERVYGGWPKCGEIDIMEHVGYRPDSVKSTVHTGAFNHMRGTQKGKYYTLPDCEEAFHVYGIDWTEEKIDFFVDDEVFFTFENSGNGWEEYPYDQRFFLIMNIAVGGTLGGKKGVDDSIWPQRMEVDYVRVFQKE